MNKSSLPILGQEEGGILGCSECSHVCHYRCCDQSRPEDPDFGPENSILLYPGEWEGVREDIRSHLLITMEDYNGGKLAYCDRENFDQSSCHPERNFKPLDCMSYPFAPAIRDGELCLLIDSKRCPLPEEQLQSHAIMIRRKWEEAIAENPAVADWIGQLSLEDYKLSIF